MESTDIIDEVWMRPRAIMTLLDISESTFYRWKRLGAMPRAHWLVLVSVARGLPVLPSRSAQWDGHFFDRNGALRTRTGYPIYPIDLWVFEFAMLNGMLRKAEAFAGETSNDWWQRAANELMPEPA